MLDELKIKTMTQIAICEEGTKKKDFKISTYYKIDYIGMRILIGLIFTTIGYALMVGGWALWKFEDLVMKLDTMDLIRETLIQIGSGLLIIWLIVGTIVGFAFNYKYNRAKRTYIRYQKEIHNLNRFYQRRRKRNG